MRRVLFPLLFAFTTCLIIFGTFEVVARLIIDDGLQYDLEMWKYARSAKKISEDPKIGHVHQPGARVHAMGVQIDINSDGFRDREFSIKKTPGTTRIMMLGDSLAFGWGVAAEDTTAKKLEKILLSNGRKIEVINTGIGNTNTSMQVANFLSHHKKYQPDVILLNYFINDAEMTPIHTHPGFFVKHSYALHFLKGRFDILLRKFSNTRQDWRQYYLNLYETQGYWIEAKNAIADLVLYCRANGIELRLVNYPVIRELNPYPFSEITKKIKSVADENSLEFLDLYMSIKDQEENTLWVTPLDPHPNAIADAIYANAIATWLENTLDFIE